MAKAKKLPSGNWRSQASFTDEDGIIHRASFTEATAKMAEAKAAMWKAGMIEKEANRRHAKLGEAIDEYIETCRVTGMSPTTIRGYVSLRRNAYESLLHKRVNNITLRDLQAWVNTRAQNVAPKTVQNSITLLQSVLKVNEVSLDFSLLRAPKQQRSEMEIPTDAQVAEMLALAYNDDNLYMAIAMAALMGLRRSEICGLRWSDIVVGAQPILRIDKALVMGEDGLHVEKAPKTNAGRRDLVIPSDLYNEMRRRRSLRQNIVSLTPNALSLKYSRLAEKVGAPSRFHNLRHYHASVMLFKGASKHYIVSDMGHSSFDMVERVYGHVTAEERLNINAGMDSHASTILSLHTKSHTLAQ